MRRSQRWGRWGPLAKSSRSTSITPDSPAKLRQTIPRFTALTGRTEVNRWGRAALWMPPSLARVLSVRTLRTYAADWALFTDWCAATDTTAPPAVVRAALGRPTGEPFQPTETDRDAVEAALRGLPSHGWTQGMFGRRDRCLVVLSQLAGVPYQHLATLTAGDVHIEEGVATIRSPAGEWTTSADGDASCADPARSRAG